MYRCLGCVFVGYVTTLAGFGNPTYEDGVGSAASFYLVFGVCVDLLGNVMVADHENQRIRKITTAGLFYCH